MNANDAEALGLLVAYIAACLAIGIVWLVVKHMEDE